MDFQLELFLVYKSPQYSLPSFESFGLSVQEFKIDFQDGLDFSNNFFLSRSHPNTSYEVSSQLVQGYRRSNLKQTVDSARQILTDHNSSHSVLCSGELKKEW